MAEHRREELGRRWRQHHGKVRTSSLQEEAMGRWLGCLGRGWWGRWALLQEGSQLLGTGSIVND
jgi:hypothetical protein